jgi:GH25 family lysozyme M1 (1,4-beta-N-acetylmuramidase)
VEEAGGTAGSLPTRLNGIDIYEANTGFPSFAKIAKAGYSFVFHKASQFWPDNKLASRWPQIAQAGMLRGAYHLLSHNAGSVAEQVERFGTTVGRLVPGDLGPSLDLEDRDAGHHSDFWIPRINQFADLIEARLGRQPIFYTSRSYWQEFANDDLGFGQYPLWVVWVNPGEPRLPAGWTKWHFWQWHWEKSTTPMPAPFAASDKGVDLDRFNGTIYQLRGMADLGHTAPHVAASQDSVAYSEVDGRIHLLESVKGSWIDHDLFNRVQWTNVIGTLPPAAGDPAAMTLGNEQVIVYRSGDGGVHALTRTIGTSDTSWHAVDITGGEGKAVGDPFIFLFENNVHVIYWDQFNTQVHVMRVKGVWQAEHFVDSVSPHTPSQISGSATAYKFQNALHIVSRSRKDGHLFDFIAPAGRAAPQDLTAASQDAGGRNPPAATYQPATYTPEGKAPRIVFRAVRGNVWQIERDTLSALDVSLDAGHAPPAAGNPTAVVADRPHIFYRTMDGTIIDIFDDAGVWRRRNVCADAAADPTAFVDSQGHAAVSFRAINGTIRIARFVNSAWNCENAARPQGAGSGESAPNGSEGAGIQRSSSLPFLLAGPIVRRATPERVWLWFACSKEPKGCQPSITAYDDKGKVWTHLVDPHFKEIVLRVEEDRVARLGENIWIVLCSAVPSSGKFPTDIILGYELSIATEENGNVKWTKLADLNLNITYAPFPRPTFVIGELNRRIAHGSCRRPGASGEDASDVFDEWMAKTAPDAFKRPASMILTGDQIYADDVAVPLFKAVRRIAFDVFGYVEKIPNPNGTALTPADNYSWTNNGQLPEFPWGLNKAAAIPAVQEMIRKVWSGRKQLTHRLTSLIGFTTDDGEAHLLSFPEYAAMYLAVWNPEICKGYGVDDGSDENLRGFERAVKAFRRVMANTATYMVSDDHDITDDWNLDQQWEETTKKNPMARRIIANGLAAFWGFQAWGNEPDDFDAGFVNIVKEHVEELRAGNGRPGNAAKQCEQTLLDRHWSFMAASNPKALCVDTRTRRETPKGKTAVLSGKRVWPFMANLLRKHGFRRGDVLLLVLPTPFLPHRSMMYIQKEEFKWPKDRYEGDFELYGNNPQQRAELVLWLEYNFAPSSLVILSGDVHHGSVITGRYGYGSSLQKIKTGQADWAMRIVQITSSPIKNVKSEAYEKKRWWTLWQTDAGNAGESLIPQWETQYATTDKNNYIAMQAFTRKLEGELGRRTYVFENHFCVVDMPSRPGALVNVLFTGVKNGRLATASIPVDTDNDPSKFQIDYVLGRELPRGVLMPGYEMEEQVIQYPPAAISIRPSLSPSNAPGLFVSPANNVAAAAGGDWRYQNPIHHAGSSVLYRARGSNPGFSEMEISSGEQFSFEQQPASGVGASGTCPPGIMPVTGSPTTASLLWTTPNPRGVCRVGTILYVVNRETGAINQFDFVTGRAGPQIWAGPGPEFGPFVGPTWVPDTSELVVAALGRDNWDPRNPRPRNPLLGTRPGTLFAVNLHSGQRTVCDQSRSAFHREALNGCAGTTMLPNGDLAVSGFWSGRVSAVDVRHGDIRPVFTNLASMASATRSNPTDTNRSPDGVRAHSSGEFLICDRTQGQLLAGRIGGTPRVLVCGIQDPIAVDIDTAGNALVLSKTNTVVYEVVLSTGAGALIARSCRPIAMAVPSGRGCLALSVDGRHRVIIVVDSDSDNSADGLYQT